ncbi:hypothetical protein SCHPADRAFT_255048 [Schizopora paradoxa]|uniref:Uncharacterized protein n=1 Tax=Schizopora paradoxa TaxID=27342 RepID=A0A0H2RUS1_9AGAM|nr:hypothetical protein SCHPADRAFT_255048 [Schizopora paradoxa]
MRFWHNAPGGAALEICIGAVAARPETDLRCEDILRSRLRTYKGGDGSGRVRTASQRAEEYGRSRKGAAEALSSRLVGLFQRLFVGTAFHLQGCSSRSSEAATEFEVMVWLGRNLKWAS